MPEKCPCEQDVAVLKARVKYYDHKFEDNGTEGYFSRFIKMEENMKTTDESLASLSTSFSALAKMDSNREAVRKALGNALVKASLIAGIFGTVITLLITLT